MMIGFIVLDMTARIHYGYKYSTENKILKT